MIKGQDFTRYAGEYTKIMFQRDGGDVTLNEMVDIQFVCGDIEKELASSDIVILDADNFYVVLWPDETIDFAGRRTPYEVVGYTEHEPDKPFMLARGTVMWYRSSYLSNKAEQQ